MTDIQMVFRANRSLIDAPPMEAYMKNQFTFLGIRAGERKKIGSGIFERKWGAARFTWIYDSLIC